MITDDQNSATTSTEETVQLSYAPHLKDFLTWGKYNKELESHK